MPSGDPWPDDQPTPPWLTDAASPAAGAVAPTTIAPLADPSSAMPAQGPPDLSLPSAAPPPNAGANLAAPNAGIAPAGPPDLSAPAMVPPANAGAQFVPPWLAAQAQPPSGAPGASSPTPATDATPSSLNSLGGVDAVSGGPAPAGAQDPHAALAAMAVDPSKPYADRAKAWTEMTPDERANTINTADPKQLASLAVDTMSPQELASIQIRQQQAKIHDETADQLRISTENRQKEQENFDQQNAAIQHANAADQQIAQDSQALVAKAKDIGKTGAGGIIGGGIAAIVGGMFIHQMGGRNLGLEGFQKGVEQKIQAQTEELNQGWKGIDLRKNLVAGELARHGDLYRAQETMRMASYQSAVNDLQTKYQDYDPQGTTAIKIATSIQGISALQQQAAAAIHQQNFKNGLELAKGQTEAAKQAEDTRHNKATEGIDWFKAGIEKDKATTAKAATQVYTPEQFKAMGYASPPSMPMTLGQYKGVQEANKDVGEIAGKGTENAQKEAGTVIRSPVTGAPLAEGGKQIVAASGEDAGKINTELVETQKFVDAASSLRNALADPPPLTDRKSWAKINADQNIVKAGQIKYWGGKITSREEKVATDMQNGDFADYTSRVKDKGTAIATMDSIIDAATRDTKTTLKGRYGFTGKVPLFSTDNPPESKATAADKQDAVLGKDYESPSVDPAALDASDRAFVEATRNGITSGPVLTEYIQNNPNLSPETVRALHAGVAPTQLQVFDSYEGAINGGSDTARTVAIDHLDAIANGSKSPEVRAYAKRLIDQASSNVAGAVTGVPEDIDVDVR
jgi:hypothetical protein